MKKFILPLLLISVVAMPLTGCTRTQLSTTAGAGIGAGVGAIASGGNTGATLIGAGAGALGGYLVGRNVD